MVKKVNGTKGKTRRLPLHINVAEKPPRESLNTGGSSQEIIEYRFHLLGDEYSLSSSTGVGPAFIFAVALVNMLADGEASAMKTFSEFKFFISGAGISRVNPDGTLTPVGDKLWSSLS